MANFQISQVTVITARIAHHLHLMVCFGTEEERVGLVIHNHSFEIVGGLDSNTNLITDSLPWRDDDLFGLRSIWLNTSMV